MILDLKKANSFDVREVALQLTFRFKNRTPKASMRVPCPCGKIHGGCVVLERYYYCNPCKKRGGGVKMVMDYKGLSCRDATLWLLERFSKKSDP